MKFKYMIRGLGIGIIITAAVMGASNRHAVADARVAVLKEYGIGEDNLLAEGTEAASDTLSEEASAEETTEQVILRDEEKEEEIYSVLDAAKDAEQQGVTPSDSETDAMQEPLEVTSSDAEPSGQEASSSEASLSEASTSEPSTALVVVPTDEGAVSGETIDIVIESGDDSGTVARKLQNAGLIENASEYDAFLMQHGYDKRLSTGTKTISVTDDWQTIADKLSRK